LKVTNVTKSEKKLLPIDENAGKFAFVDYTFINIKKLNESDAETIGKMNVWYVNDMLDK